MMTLKQKHELNLRDLGGIPLAKGCVPEGLYLRSGKLSILSKEECKLLCDRYHIHTVIDLRTPIEVGEFPDPLPEGVEYLSIPIFEDSTAGITHESGSDPMEAIRKMRKNPQELIDRIPDFYQLYRSMVSEPYSCEQLDKVLEVLRKNASAGHCTLFHCTAGKDRTGIVAMALLRELGAADSDIERDYLRTNRNAFFSTFRKCVAIFFLTGNLKLVKAVWRPFMANKSYIRIAMEEMDKPR